MRIWLEWVRNAVVTTKAEQQKDSADIFGEAKPLLSDWLQEVTRDEIIAALMALPSESQPAAGVRVNGIQYDLATAAPAQHLAGSTISIASCTVPATANCGDRLTPPRLANVDATADKFTAPNLSLLKRVAMGANPRIRPYKTRDGYEYFVAFAGVERVPRPQGLDCETVNKDARSREGRRGQRCSRQPAVPRRGPDLRRRDRPAGAGDIAVRDQRLDELAQDRRQRLGTRVEPVFLCGQQAAVIAYGQMAKPTFSKEDDYGFVTGTGIEAAYGVGKIFKKHPKTGTRLVQWGVATGFYASAAD